GGLSAARPMDNWSPQRAMARARAVNRRVASLQTASPALRRPLPQMPVVASLTLATGDVTGYTSFSALNAFDSDSNPNNHAFNRIGTEPPDQGLCVGDGIVVEVVNLVFVAYGLQGNAQSSIADLSSLFGVPQTNFLSDPRCYYDVPSQTFFITATDLGDSDPANNIWSSTSSLLIGVMPASSGQITTFELSTTDLTNPYGICPCFADQPLLGADQNGIYITGNEFALSQYSFFDGAEVFAISKSDLIANSSPANAYVFPAPIGLVEGTAASIQPAVPAQGVFDTSNNGTEYFMSSLDFNSTRDNRIAVWAMTNTCTLTSACPNGSPLLSWEVVPTSTYGVPPRAHQMKSVFPVGQSVRARLETIDTGDDRLQQVVYAGGKLYAGLTTVLKVGGRLHSGILYFIVQPSISAGAISVASISANYAALTGADLYYPSIAANSNGSAVMAFSMSGPHYFPSSAYMPLTSDVGAQAIYIGQAGAASYDGASGYRRWGGRPPARWGDYSAAFADDNGNLWMASEFAGESCTKQEWLLDNTCGGIRGNFANWATSIGYIPAP
ncbi:MAG TPA: hypothetical protein VJ718_11040, partial [Candidatus Binataceae bacterium]|nr:hypothetical protein [Candidatus Binataceae bacterium]